MDNILMDYTGFLRRVIAGLIDLLIIIIIYAVVLNIEFGILGYYYMDFNISNTKYSNYIFLLMVLSAVIIFLGYFSIFESSKLKGGFGKSIMKIWVVDRFGYKLRITKAFIRALFKLISIFIYISYISILFTKKKITFYDYILGTYVINRQELKVDNEY